MALWMKKVQDAEEAEKLDERDEVLQGLETQYCTSMMLEYEGCTSIGYQLVAQVWLCLY